MQEQYSVGIYARLSRTMNAPVSLCLSKIKKKCSPGMCGNRDGRSTITTVMMESPVRPLTGPGSTGWYRTRPTTRSIWY